MIPSSKRICEIATKRIATRKFHTSREPRAAKRTFRAERTSTLSPTSVWTEFTPLAQKHNAVNLGQGFPDFLADGWILEAAKDAIDRGLVQYTRSQGHLRLVNALSRFYSPLFQRNLDPMTNAQVLIGATEAIFASFMAFCNPGDEVLLIEPFYDSYPACVTLAGGKSVFVPLRPKDSSNSANDWKLDINELRAAITPKTKILVLNNPTNPVGKVYTRSELEEISKLVIENDLLLISDEVYEFHIYDDPQNKEGHIRIATLPGMWKRTITIGSAGKAFNVTGFKLGWVFADAPMIEALQSVHTHATFSVTTPMAEAIAIALEQAEERKYFEHFRDMFSKKRKEMADILTSVGLKPIMPQGSYFILADTSVVPDSKFLDTEALKTGVVGTSRDYQFCRWLTKEIGVAAIPPSAFYSKEHQHMAGNYARFAFCKKEESLRAAAERLKKLL